MSNCFSCCRKQKEEIDPLPGYFSIEKMNQFNASINDAARKSLFNRTGLVVLGTLLLSGIAFSLWFAHRKGCFTKAVWLKGHSVLTRSEKFKSIGVIGAVTGAIIAAPVGMVALYVGTKAFIEESKLRAHRNQLPTGEATAKNHFETL